jgi:chemotaxis protein CheD
LKPLIVGVGDCKVTGDPAAELVTYALGSCIAVSVWDPVSKASGLLHFMLPESSVDPGGGSDRPFRYADTGTPLLFRRTYEAGGEKRRLVVRIAGGAAVVDDGGVFSIGKRNYAALKKLLWKAGVLIHGEAVGGTVSRTVRLEAGSGRFLVREAGGTEWEMPAQTGRGPGMRAGAGAPLKAGEAA